MIWAIWRSCGMLLLVFLLAGQDGGAQTGSALSRATVQREKICLPTGVYLDPAGPAIAVGNMPLAMLFSPEGDRLIISLNGWRQQGLQVVDRETRRVVQTLSQPGAFFGLAFSNDGRTLYTSGGNEDVIYRYSWHDKQATLVDRIILAPKQPQKDGTRYPAGIALSRDGRTLFVAENLADSLAVVDLQSSSIVQRLHTGPYPYGVVVGPNGKVYVSAWGGNTVSVFASDGGGPLREAAPITVGRHPSALLLNPSGSRLFAALASTSGIAVIDTRTEGVLTTLLDPPPASPIQGSTPNGLALSSDGSRLFVAEADNNAVAVFDLSKETAGLNLSTGLSPSRSANKPVGRIPVGWYPTALLMTTDALFVLNGKGNGTKPNPGQVQPDKKLPDTSDTYTLGQLNGTIITMPASISRNEMIQFTRRVSRANNWDRRISSAARYPPFKHVIYIIKENRTYDQVMGDLAQGDGDPSLLFFPRPVGPNHHALGERFGLFDRFFVNAEVSSQGHVWSTAAYVTDYTEKTTPSIYSNRRDSNDKEDVDEPASGYLWNAAVKKGLSLRNYGEFAEPLPSKNSGERVRYHAVKPALNPYTSPDYPAFDMKISDQARADVWLKEFQGYVEQDNLPALEILHLPRDHTAGARPGLATPRACFADNDLALGRMVEAVSHSPYWQDTVFFVLEDDAQDGPDHVDSHRSVLLVISAYNRGGTIHRFVNTTDVVATMEEILKLPALSQFDFYGQPLAGIFDYKPDLRPYVALKPEQSIDELNPPQGAGAEASMRLDLDHADKADMNQFNQILWRAIEGEKKPYPGSRRISSLELARGQ